MAGTRIVICLCRSEKCRRAGRPVHRNTETRIAHRGEVAMSMRSNTRLGAALGFAAAIALSAGTVSAQQAAAIKLFKVITAKDEVEIGLTDEELRSFGPLPDVENLAQHLVDAGQMTVWQYAVKRASDGGTVHAPLRRIAIFKS